MTAPNRFQVYRGELPPPAVPMGLTAKAQPAGKVKLAWLAAVSLVECAALQNYPEEDSDIRTPD